MDEEQENKMYEPAPAVAEGEKWTVFLIIGVLCLGLYLIGGMPALLLMAVPVSASVGLDQLTTEGENEHTPRIFMEIAKVWNDDPKNTKAVLGIFGVVQLLALMVLKACGIDYSYRTATYFVWLPILMVMVFMGLNGGIGNNNPTNSWALAQDFFTFTMLNLVAARVWQVRMKHTSDRTVNIANLAKSLEDSAFIFFVPFAALTVTTFMDIEDMVGYFCRCRCRKNSNKYEPVSLAQL